MVHEVNLGSYIFMCVKALICFSLSFIYYSRRKNNWEGKERLVFILTLDDFGLHIMKYASTANQVFSCITGS